MCVIVLTRAIPGGGKTTIVKAIQQKYPETVVCSADDFFTQDGVYNFDIRNLSAAHAACKEKFFKAIDNDELIVICDNTNITWTEVQYYAELAAICNYTIILSSPDTPWVNDPEECFKKTTHDVPLDRIKKMYDKWKSSESIRDRIWELDEFAKVIISRGVEETIFSIKRTIENEI
jgi:hypothetical protein